MTAALVLAPLLPVGGAQGDMRNAAEHSPEFGPVCINDLAKARVSFLTLQSRGYAKVLRDIKGDEADAWINKLNAFPPRTDYAGDTVLAIVASWSKDVLFGIYRNGCEVTSGSLSPLAFRAIDRAAAAALGLSA